MQLSEAEGGLKLGFAEAGEPGADGATYEAKWFVKSSNGPWGDTPSFAPYKPGGVRSVDRVSKDAFLMLSNDAWLTGGTSNQQKGFRLKLEFVRKVRLLAAAYPKEYGDGRDASPDLTGIQQLVSKLMPCAHVAFVATGAELGEAHLTGMLTLMERGLAAFNTSRCLILQKKTVLVDSNVHTIVIECDQSIDGLCLLGFVSFRTKEITTSVGTTTGYIEELHVTKNPMFARKGIASALLMHAERIMMSAGCGRGCLTFFTSNTPAAALYEKAGYGAAQTDWQGDKLIVFKDLLPRSGPLEAEGAGGAEGAAKRRAAGRGSRGRPPKKVSR
jgi:ribosomal protein S18 acetylase RimI-like enzyme